MLLISKDEPVALIEV